MKKSIVALAALAVVGAASAQVTITGTTSFGYQSSLDGTRGIAMSDNSIFLGDTEDLGGGTKLVMSTGFDAGGRSYGISGTAGTANAGANTGNFAGENSSLKLIGGFGAVTLRSFASDGALINVQSLSGASLPYSNFQVGSKGLNTPETMRNGIQFASPSMSGFVVSLDYVTLAGQFASNSVFDEKTKTVPAVTYTSGPLKAYVEYAYLNGTYNTATGAGSNVGGAASADDAVTQPTVFATYDFGSAKVGAGWTKPTNNGATIVLGANTSVGALTFGLATFSYNGPNSASNVGTATWTEGSVDYALSKRTSLKLSAAQVNDNFNAYAGASAYYNGGASISGTTLQSNGQYRVGLYHSF